MEHEELKELMETSLIERIERILSQSKEPIGITEAFIQATMDQYDALLELGEMMHDEPSTHQIRAYVTDRLTNGGNTR